MVEMGSIIFRIIGLLIVLLGIIMVYDARILTKRFFSFGDQNEGSLGLKLLGGLICIVGAIIVYFTVR